MPLPQPTQPFTVYYLDPNVQFVQSTSLNSNEQPAHIIIDLNQLDQNDIDDLVPDHNDPYELEQSNYDSDELEESDIEDLLMLLDEADEQTMVDDIEKVDTLFGENTREIMGLNNEYKTEQNNKRTTQQNIEDLHKEITECTSEETIIEYPTCSDTVEALPCTDTVEALTSFAQVEILPSSALECETLQTTSNTCKNPKKVKNKIGLFTRDYHLKNLNCKKLPLPVRGEIEREKILRPEFIVCASFLNPKTQKVLTITKAQIDSFFGSKLTKQQIKQAFSGLLKEKEDLAIRAFNYLEPFLRQNYVDNVLFVNQHEFNLQLRLIKKDLKVFSDNNNVLETFFMFHEGLILELLPLSCMLGAFLYHVPNDEYENYQQLDKQTGIIASSLTQIVETNKVALLRALEKFYLASSRNVDECVIMLQPYLLDDHETQDLEDETFQFSGKRIGKKAALSYINFKKFENSKTVDKLEVLQAINMFIKQHRLHDKQVLFCFELVFQSSMDKLHGLVKEKQLYYVRNSFYGFNKLKTPLDGKGLVRHSVAANLDSSYSALLLKLKNKLSGRRKEPEPELKDDSEPDQSDIDVSDESEQSSDSDEPKQSKLSEREQLEEPEIVYDKYGLLIRKENFQDIIPLGSNTKFHLLKKIYAGPNASEKNKQEIRRQNSIPTQKLSISYLMKNFLFANRSPVMVTAKEECLAQQKARITTNLTNLFAGVQLQTEFVLLNGFLCRLEPFEVLIAVVFDGLKPEDIKQTVSATKDFAVNFLVENKLMKEIKHFFGESCFELIGQQFPYHNGRAKPKLRKKPFYYSLRGNVNKEQVLDCSNNWARLLSFNKSNFESHFEGVCVFKLSLCPKSMVCCSAFTNDNKYVYRLFTKEVINNKLVRTNIIRELEDLLLKKETKKRKKKSEPSTVKKVKT